MTTTSPLSGLPVSVLSSASEAGERARRSRRIWTSVPSGISEVDAADSVLLVDQGKGHYVAVPFDRVVGGRICGTFGGRFIYTSDSRLRSIAQYPTPLLDVDLAAQLTPAVGEAEGGLSCDVLFAEGYRSCALSGPTEYFDKVRLYDAGKVPDDVDGADVLVRMEHPSVKGYFFAVPLRYARRGVHTMMGGNFVFQNSVDYVDAFGHYPLPVHDRCECPTARYEAGFATLEVESCS